MKRFSRYLIATVVLEGCAATSQPIVDSDFIRKNRCYPTPVEEYLNTVHDRIWLELTKTGIRKKYREVPNVDGELRIDQYGAVLGFKVNESVGYEKNNEYLGAVTNAVKASQPYPVMWDGSFFKGTLPITLHPNSMVPPGCW